MTKKFTRGKWFVENYYDVFSDNGHEDVYIGALSGASYDEVKANARAIAAVPEMYRVLEELIPILESNNRLAISAMVHSIEKLLARIDGTEAKS